MILAAYLTEATGAFGVLFAERRLDQNSRRVARAGRIVAP
jgi:hypothetical protein